MQATCVSPIIGASPHAKGFAAMSTRRPAIMLALAAACAAMLCAGHAGAATSVLDYGNGAPRVGSATDTSDFELLAPDPDGFDLKPGQFTWLPASEEPS